jgi:hypothetical protein
MNFAYDVFVRDVSNATASANGLPLDKVDNMTVITK